MVLVENYTFKLSDNGIVLNTDSLSFPFVDITRVAGLANAPYRITERDHEGTDGGYIDADFEKGRNIVLEGFVYADASTMESYLDSLKANYAPVSSVIPFYLLAPGTNERLLFVKSLGLEYDWDTSRRIGIAEVQIRMFAEDPRIYESTLMDIDIELGGMTTEGFGFNLGFNFGFGSTSQTGEGENLFNSGNRSTPAIITFFGPVTNPEIRNDTTGNALRFIINVDTSETLVVDLANHTVRLNGTSNRRNTLLSPDWFMLQPGDNFIRYHAGSSAPSIMNVQYRSAWR